MDRNVMIGPSVGFLAVPLRRAAPPGFAVALPAAGPGRRAHAPEIPVNHRTIDC